VFALLVPMLTLALIVNPMSRGFEHYPMSVLAADDPRRFDLRFNTVTVTHRLIGLTWANINYHVEHHLYPRVPFFNLPALHRLLNKAPYLQRVYPLHGSGDLAARLNAHAAPAPVAAAARRDRRPLPAPLDGG
jgi:fatty acid desaturase